MPEYGDISSTGLLVLYVPPVALPLSRDSCTVNSASRTAVLTGSRHTCSEPPSVIVTATSANLRPTTAPCDTEKERQSQINKTVEKEKTDKL